ncbi:hypothetical protein BgiMline_004355 [Biomphalaria glabrata]
MHSKISDLQSRKYLARRVATTITSICEYAISDWKNIFNEKRFPRFPRMSQFATSKQDTVMTKGRVEYFKEGEMNLREKEGEMNQREKEGRRKK